MVHHLSRTDACTASKPSPLHLRSVLSSNKKAWKKEKVMHRTGRDRRPYRYRTGRDRHPYRYRTDRDRRSYRHRTGRDGRPYRLRLGVVA